MDALTRMRAYVAVVDNEGFSAAARAQGRSKALLSKYVRELEDDLGVLLLNRTTRQFSLTEAGHAYYKRVVDVLRDFDALHDEIRDQKAGLSGAIRLSAPRAMEAAGMGQSLVDFAVANPDIKLEMSLEDRFVDLVEEGFDLAIRITQLQDSGLIARRLSPFRLVLCATPAVIARYGAPDEPAALAGLPFVVDSNARRRNAIVYRDAKGGTATVPIDGRIVVNSPLAARMAALADIGFVVSPDFTVHDDLSAGRLVEVLPGLLGNDAGIYAVYPHRRYLPARVRALVDHLAEWFRDNCPPRPEAKQVDPS
ncbi:MULTISPECIES: LysR family transcriptional regulator [unclassified Roseitalea]|uniref:LysR family transcriptional regulator n=1 Tax=unclassified Roseitalea TaxID=2639107 RepID=UPI0027400663|nr:MULTISPECIES: LysR family transcriptional regulator [unclassified Roseitalea]